jgi:hypothetical protein
MPTLFLNEVAGNSWFGNGMKKPSKKLRSLSYLMLYMPFISIEGFNNMSHKLYNTFTAL